MAVCHTLKNHFGTASNRGGELKGASNLGLGPLLWGFQLEAAGRGLLCRPDLSDPHHQPVWMGSCERDLGRGRMALMARPESTLQQALDRLEADEDDALCMYSLNH